MPEVQFHKNGLSSGLLIERSRSAVKRVTSPTRVVKDGAQRPDSDVSQPARITVLWMGSAAIAL